MPSEFTKAYKNLQYTTEEESYNTVNYRDSDIHRKPATLNV